KLETRNSKLETRNSKLETRNSKLETRNSKLETFMSDELIKVAEDDGIVTVTLNRPERLNALVGHMRRDLAEALEEAGSDPHVRVVVLGGEGRAFCAGGDVNFMAELVERREA